MWLQLANPSRYVSSRFGWMLEGNSDGVTAMASQYSAAVSTSFHLRVETPTIPRLSPFVGSRRFPPSTDSPHFPGILKSKGKRKPQWCTSRRTICSVLKSATAVRTVVSVVHSQTLHYLQLFSLSTSNDMILLKKWFPRLGHLESIMLAGLNPATAKVALGFVGPFLSAYGFLFILRIVMSWYPKLPVEKFPFTVAYAPTEPLLKQTRKLIPPVGGVDVTPVVWFGLLSFLNEILVGPQGLLVLLSQQALTGKLLSTWSVGGQKWVVSFVSSTATKFWEEDNVSVSIMLIDGCRVH